MFSKRFLKVGAFFSLLSCLLFVGCTQPTDDDDFVDDHQLNSALIGTWRMDYEGGYDEYVINTNTIAYNGWTTVNYHIEYVYNFNAAKTAGCIIVKNRAANNYTAVYFKNLQANQVLLGEAYNVTDYTIPVAVATLDAAKAKFKPADADKYGGGSAQGGTPQIKQN